MPPGGDINMLGAPVCWYYEHCELGPGKTGYVYHSCERYQLLKQADSCITRESNPAIMADADEEEGAAC